MPAALGFGRCAAAGGTLSAPSGADTAQVQIYRDLAANRQDPSTAREMRVGGLMIDSTKPVGRPFPPLGRCPQEALERIALEDLQG